MIEEELRRIDGYSDSILLKLIEEQSWLPKVVGGLARIFLDLRLGKIKKTERDVEILRSYFITVIRNSSVFGFDSVQASTSVETFLLETNKINLSILDVLDETEASEEILTVAMSFIPTQNNEKLIGKEGRMKDSLLFHEKIMNSKLGRKILKRGAIWGLSYETDTDIFSPWVYEQCRSSMLFVHPEYPYILRLYPKYPTAISVTDKFVKYPDFYKKSKGDLDLAKRSIKKRIEVGCDKIFILIKTLILQDKSVKNNFIQSIYNIYNANREREKTSYRLNSVIGDGPIFTISNILSRFISPIVNDMEKMKGIPLDFLPNTDYLGDVTYLGIEGEIKKTRNANNETFLTQIFYAKLLFNQISYVPMCLNFSTYQTEVSRTRRAVTNAAPEDVANTKTVLSIMESEYEYVKMILSVENVLKVEDSVIMYIISFLNNSIGKKDFSKLPVFIMESTLLMMVKMLYVQQTFGRMISSNLTAEDIRKVYRLSSLVLGEKNVNINYKQEALRLLLTYSESALYVPGVVTSTVGYFIQIQKDMKGTEDKLEERSKVACTLKNLLVDYMAKEEMIKILQPAGISTTEDHMDTKTLFILHMLSAMTDSQEKGFDDLRRISQIERTLLNNPEDKEQLEESLLHIVDSATRYFSILSVIEEMVFVLLDLCKKVFFSPIIVNRFASMLNSSIISLAGNKSGELRVVKRIKTFSAVDLLRSRLRMYVELRSVVFARAVAEDNGMFKSELFKKAVEICERKCRLTQGEKAYCLIFIKTVENLENSKDRSADEVEYPEEFIDPLTYGVMTDPVILKTSNTRVDRTTASMILMNDPIDPFTREKLTEADVVGDKELKERIARFLSSIQKGK